MKNKILAVTISLCLIFCSVVPSYAVTESLVTGFSNPSLSNTVSAYQAITSIVSYLANISAAFTYDAQGNSPIDNISNALSHIEGWLVPDGSRGSNDPTVWQVLVEASTALYQYLPQLPAISSYISSWMASNNSYLLSEVKALTNVSKSNLTFDAEESMHSDLVYSGNWYEFPDLLADMNISRNGHQWLKGSPIGNLALMLKISAENVAIGFKTLAKNYNDTLTTWEHSTNTQTTFTPSSAINGLYRYLAYIQSDTSYWSYYGVRALTNWYKNTVFDYGIRQDVAHTDVVQNTGSYLIYNLTSAGQLTNETHNYKNGSPLGNIFLSVLKMNQNIVDGFSKSIYSFNSAQTPLSWLTASNGTSFTPLSFGDGVYKWLSNIQNPVARLAFVNADDTDIAAKRNSHNNEVAVQQSFMDPNGSGSATASDFGALASASGSVKTNFNTGVSASGVFDVFNQSYDWFSQTTANNLDTVGSGSRLSKKGVNEYETTYLDDYYKEIYSLIEDHPIETYEFIEDQTAAETDPLLGE